MRHRNSTIQTLVQLITAVLLLTSLPNAGKSQSSRGGIPSDPVEAKEWLTKMEQSGDGAAQCRLGNHYQGCFNVREAAKWFRLAANQNYAEAQYWLGNYYLNGTGVEQNEERGLDLIQLAADQNFLEASLHLAVLYGQGVGEPRNERDQPLQLLEHAVQTHPHEGGAYSALIYWYEFELGNNRDLVAAIQWYCRAALAGAPNYTLHTNVDPGYAVSYSLYTFDSHNVGLVRTQMPDIGGPLNSMLPTYLKAARLNDAQALRRIGEMYLKGDDVPVSALTAWPWLTLAAQKGDTWAAGKVAQIESNMARSELDDAKKKLPSLVQELEAVAAVQPVTP